MKDDGARFYFFGKAVKDYIIMTKKQEFTYEEIQELIESRAILNYCNDIVKFVMEDWVRYMETHHCYRPGENCPPEVLNKPVHFLKPMQYYLFDSTWVMV